MPLTKITKIIFTKSFKHGVLLGCKIFCYIKNITYKLQGEAWDELYLRKYEIKWPEILTSGVVGEARICIKISLKMVIKCGFY